MDYPKFKIQSNKHYFSMTFSASRDGKIVLGGQTMWVGYADTWHQVELRQFSLVKADRMADYWIKLEMPFCVVNDDNDFAKWFVSGGHALVEKDIAECFLGSSLEPNPCVQFGKAGFSGINIQEQAIFKKAPSPKKRMEVLKRDRFKCKVCGRSPDNYVDIELHLHHIRPVGEGGFTHEENLITLCDTCHRGLDPHFEWSLYDLLDEVDGASMAVRERRKYFQEVKQYREARKKLDSVNGM